MSNPKVRALCPICMIRYHEEATHNHTPGHLVNATRQSMRAKDFCLCENTGTLLRLVLPDEVQRAPSYVHAGAPVEAWWAPRWAVLVALNEDVPTPIRVEVLLRLLGNDAEREAMLLYRELVKESDGSCRDWLVDQGLMPPISRAGKPGGAP